MQFCATDALKFGEEEDFAAEIAQAEIMLPPTGNPLGARPRVYYLNLPRLFIAGEVWDPAEDEIIEGAKVTLTASTGLSRETTTDAFGDFWFRRLNPDIYNLKIEAQGYQTVVKNGIKLEESLNIGDIPMHK